MKFGKYIIMDCRKMTRFWKVLWFRLAHLLIAGNGTVSWRRYELHRVPSSFVFIMFFVSTACNCFFVASLFAVRYGRLLLGDMMSAYMWISCHFLSFLARCLSAKWFASHVRCVFVSCTCCCCVVCSCTWFTGMQLGSRASTTPSNRTTASAF